ncbi:hypothetical protein FRC09_016743 [Ceratobasidium sp. 395]|nr:hypothetical protein FRC09_016743 [Ceratobasidium sp. 395]
MATSVSPPTPTVDTIAVSKPSNYEGTGIRAGASGYDQGIMSGAITDPQLKAYFKQSDIYQIGTMVAILEVGAFTAGRIADIIGRRRTLFGGAVVFVVGGVIQTFTNGFRMMVLGRIVSGFGVGMLSTIVPIYQSEISPAEYRGMLACIGFTGNIVGYAWSVVGTTYMNEQWVDYFCSFLESDVSWRLPLSMQCATGSILAADSLLLPESLCWLIGTDKLDEGRRVVDDLRGGDPNDIRAEAEFNEIKNMVEKDGLSWFSNAGWIGWEAILMTGINGIIYNYPPNQLLSWYFVDVWGRRVILMSGVAVMAYALASTGWFMYIDQVYTPDAVVACVIMFNAAFGFSWGPLPWLYPPEIMPLAFRAKCVSMSTATNWLFNWIVGQVTPALQEVITWPLYPMHAFFCLCSLILVYFLYPETKGIPLEEMDIVFGEEPTPGDDDDDSETSSLVRGRPRTYDSPAGSDAPVPLRPEEREGG